MDIHRCRFLPPSASPAGINALAFSHGSSSTTKTPSTLRLALGRADGSIEIWRPSPERASSTSSTSIPSTSTPSLSKESVNGFIHEITIPGAKGRSIESLVWTQDFEDVDSRGNTSAGRLRLFSIGFSNAVTEWDLAKRTPRSSIGGNHNEIWCFGAQPRFSEAKASRRELDLWKDEGEKSSLSQILACGTGDGSVVLYSTAEGEVKFLRALVPPSGKKGKSRALCLKWVSREVLVVGYSDSKIRVFNTLGRGSVLKEMSLGSQPGSKKGPSSEILVWAITVLRDGSIVSGDSTGEIKVFDGKTYTLKQRVKGHEADVLCLESSLHGNILISGGLDRRTTRYILPEGPDGKITAASRWMEHSHSRMHAADVKALAFYEDRNTSVAVSAGLDAKAITMPLRDFGRKYHRALSTAGATSRMSTAGELLASWWEREVWIWRVRSRTTSRKNARVQEQDDDESDEDEKDPHELVSRIALDGEANISTADLSSDGSALAVGTIEGVKVFSLSSSTEKLRVRKVDLPPRLSSTGVKEVKFSPDGHWLLTISCSDTITLWRIRSNINGKSKLEVLHTPITLKRKTRQVSVPGRITIGTLGDFTTSIARVAISPDSRLVLVADFAGFTDYWTLKPGQESTQRLTNGTKTNGTTDSDSDSDSESEDEQSKNFSTNLDGESYTVTYSDAMPRSALPPLVVALQCSDQGRYNLLTISVAHALYVHELTATSATLSPWSRRNTPEIQTFEFRNEKDQARGAFFASPVLSSVQQGNRVWVHGTSWLWMFDLSMDFSEEGAKPREKGKGKRKREWRDLKAGRDVFEDDEAGEKRLLNPRMGDEVHNAEGENEGGAAVEMALARRTETGNAEGEKGNRKANWKTYTYGPIVGLGVLSSTSSSASRTEEDVEMDVDVDGNEGEEVLESILLEGRVGEITARWEGKQEWKKG